MTESSRQILRQAFLLNYDDLKIWLTQRLRSAELASDALQDAWLQLEKVEPSGPVQRPRAYIMRIAFNIALKHLRGRRETVTLDDARGALGLADEAPDPGRVAEARSEMEALKRAVADLTPRRREILFASRLEGVPLHELAARYGVSQRLIERELRHAVYHCAERFDRKVVQRFGPRPRHASIHSEPHRMPTEETEE
jgi:RNA polymerase sigma-70 factor (ECF subfamily)